MQLQPNTLFDNRYTLKRLIGRGGFAEVWLAEDQQTHFEEALKIYAPGAGMDDDGVQMFIKELQVVHGLRHTNLLGPKFMSQYERQPYLVMDYCPNGSLSKKIGNISEEEAWKVLHQVASGLAYLHEKGIVHQDIKPDNILIDSNGDYVITDFGISMKAQSTLRKSMRATAESGTINYMAPERMAGARQPQPEHDIWSLGAMMYELLEGDVPFNTPVGSLVQQNGAPIPEMEFGVSARLKESIFAMLDLDVAQRPKAMDLAGVVSTPSSKRAKPEQQIDTTFVPASTETVRVDVEKIKREEEVKREETERVRKERAARKAQKQTKFCASCGTTLQSNVMFCPRCGHKVGAPITKAQPKPTHLFDIESLNYTSNEDQTFTLDFNFELSNASHVYAFVVFIYGEEMVVNFENEKMNYGEMLLARKDSMGKGSKSSTYDFSQTNLVMTDDGILTVYVCVTLSLHNDNNEYAEDRKIVYEMKVKHVSHVFKHDEWQILSVNRMDMED